MIETQVQLKGLNTRKSRLQEEVKQLRDQVADLSRNINQKNAQMQDIDRQIASLQKKDIIVSEHAILRFIERTMGLDVEAIKAHIVSDTMKTQIAALGGKGVFPHPQGGKLRVNNNTVVTIID